MPAARRQCEEADVSSSQVITDPLHTGGGREDKLPKGLGTPGHMPAGLTPCKKGGCDLNWTPHQGISSPDSLA